MLHRGGAENAEKARRVARLCAVSAPPRLRGELPFAHGTLSREITSQPFGVRVTERNEATQQTAESKWLEDNSQSAVFSWSPVDRAGTPAWSNYLLNCGGLSLMVTLAISGPPVSPAAVRLTFGLAFLTGALATAVLRGTAPAATDSTSITFSE